MRGSIRNVRGRGRLKTDRERETKTEIASGKDLEAKSGNGMTVVEIGTGTGKKRRVKSEIGVGKGTKNVTGRRWGIGIKTESGIETKSKIGRGERIGSVREKRIKISAEARGSKTWKESGTGSVGILEDGATRIKIEAETNSETATAARKRNEIEITDWMIEARRGTVNVTEIEIETGIIRIATMIIIAQSENGWRTLPLRLWFWPALVLLHPMSLPACLVHIAMGRYPLDLLLPLELPRHYHHTQSLVLFISLECLWMDQTPLVILDSWRYWPPRSLQCILIFRDNLNFVIIL